MNAVGYEHSAPSECCEVKNFLHFNWMGQLSTRQKLKCDLQLTLLKWENINSYVFSVIPQHNRYLKLNTILACVLNVIEIILLTDRQTDKQQRLVKSLTSVEERKLFQNQSVRGEKHNDRPAGPINQLWSRKPHHTRKHTYTLPFSLSPLAFLLFPS